MIYGVLDGLQISPLQRAWLWTASFAVAEGVLIAFDDAGLFIIGFSALVAWRIGGCLTDAWLQRRQP
jgi:hypothetical protein